ncbi:hypothetical protein C3Y87_11840 [Carbonactinospora thermoautotrophica]|uniref:helix-turn-helix domain-containing protein n=1 Tax=Carbonactinospora thermoautotrophica TaxID=1469144 RepID=UPI002271AA0C|nr:helix-turn-helix transcriptional regulator [Carbonactinospora thermoautotrophica]MCX9192092.1 hypothetical protein [Carbonactinospora thermoautotrophica]
MDHRRERLRELGRRVRLLRAEARLTGVELAERSGVAQATVSKIETGRMLPSVEVVERIADALGLDPERRGELLELVARLHSEIERRRRFSGPALARQEAIGERERAAEAIRAFQCAVIPGLLQTAEYARHAFAAYRFFDEQDVSRAVAARVARQELLYSPNRHFHFVLTEGALRTWPGSPALMLAQLDRLAQVSTLENVRLGVVPWDSPVPEVPLHGFAVYDEKAVSIETFGSDVVLLEEPDVQMYLDIFAAFGEAAIYGDAVRELLARLADEYRALASSK